MAGKRIGVSVSAGERARIAAAANALGMSVAGWVRRQAVSATAGSVPLPTPLQEPQLRKPAVKHTHAAMTNLTEEQFAALVAHARACGLTVSGFIRGLLFGRKLIPRRPLLCSAIVAVQRAGNTLSQMVRLASSGGALGSRDLLCAVAALRDEIHELRDALLTADAATARDPSD